MAGPPKNTTGPVDGTVIEQEPFMPFPGYVGPSPIFPPYPIGSTGSTGSTGTTYVNPTYYADNSAGGVIDKPTAPAINEIAKKSIQRTTVVGDNTVIPILYGECRVFGQVIAVTVTAGSVVASYAFGEGVIDSYTKVLINGEEVADDVVHIREFWYGAVGQGVSPKLAHPIMSTYADVNTGVAYVVVKWKVSELHSFPRLEAIVKGKKVYDVRLDSTNGGSGSHRLADKTTWAYSDNPTICFADFAVQYAKWSVNWPSIADNANANDEMVSGKKRRLIGLALLKPATAESWIDAFQVYIGAFVVRESGVVRVIPDRADVGITGALKFTASGSGEISFGDVLDVGTADFTIECVVKLESAVSANTGLLHKKSAFTTVADVGWALYLGTDKKINMVISDGTNQVIATSTNAIPEGTEVYISASIDRGTDFIRLYFDGVADGGSVANIVSVTGTLSNADALKCIGTAGGATPTITLDEVRLWNDVRTPTEIADNMLWEVNNGDGSLAGYWPMNQTSGTTVTDDRAGNNGTITGTYSWVAGLKVIPYNVAMHITPDLLKENSITLKHTGVHNTPTVVSVDYTDSSDTEWRSVRQTAQHPDVDVTVSRRLSRISLPGIHRASQAKREAIERLNYFLNDLEAKVVLHDEGILLQIGSIVAVTHGMGLAQKLFRVMGLSKQVDDWSLDLKEYDPASYSNVVVSDPTFPNISIGTPLSVPAGPTPTVVEKNAVMDVGVVGTYGEVTFTGTTWSFVRNYRVKVYTGSHVLLNVLIPHLGAVTHNVSTPQLAQGVVYIVEVYIVSVTGNLSAVPGTVNYTSIGDLVLPTSPTNMTGYEAGQLVSLTWVRSIDKDLQGYKIKRLTKALYDAAIIAPTDPWVHASCVTVVDRVDATVFLTPDQPTGEYYFMVKAFDSGNRESTNYSACYINVTADAAGGTGIERVYPERCVVTPDVGAPLYFNVGDVLDPGTADFTVEGWVRVDLTGPNGGVIATKINVQGWAIGINSSGQAFGYIADSVTPLTVTDATVYGAFSTLHIAMVVKQSTDQLYLYVNGTAVGGSPVNMAAITGTLSNTAQLELAVVNDTSRARYYAFRDIRYWNVARTASQIADNRWRILTPPVTNLVGFWLCDEDDEGTMFDTSGSGYHGAVNDDSPEYWTRIHSYFNVARMHVYEIHGDSLYAVTSPKILWTGTGGLTSGQIWTYNAGDSSGDRWFDLMQTGTQTVNASFETATFDAGRDIQGKWTSAPEITLFGAATAETKLRLALEATPGVFTDYAATEAVNAIARYMRYKVEETSLLSAVGMLVRLPCQVSFQGRIVEDTQQISVTANPTAVVWVEPFSAIPQVSTTLIGTTARIIAVDGLSKTGANLYAWDAAGVAATATVRITARGP